LPETAPARAIRGRARVVYEEAPALCSGSIDATTAANSRGSIGFET
jgi:hypothetical protein